MSTGRSCSALSIAPKTMARLYMLRAACPLVSMSGVMPIGEAMIL